jgi:hypothetical protein
MQMGSAYHTIRHPVYPRYEEVWLENDMRNIDSYISWNLPLPFRQVTKEEHLDLMAWLAEVNGSSEQTRSRPNTQARIVQPILHCLRAGLTFDQMMSSLPKDLRPFGDLNENIDQQYNALSICNTYKSSAKQRKIKLAGDEIVTIFTSWDEGGQHLTKLRARSRREAVHAAGAADLSREGQADPTEFLAAGVETVMIDLT